MEEFTSKNKGMELGLYALEDHLAPQDNETPMTEYKRMKNMVEMGKIAEDVGLDVFGIGESHEERFIIQLDHGNMPHKKVMEMIELFASEVAPAIQKATKNLKLTKEVKIMGMEKFRIDDSKGLEFGIYTLGDHIQNPATGKRISAQQRIKEIIELAKLAEQAGIDFISVGESHQEYFATQAHSVVIAAIAQATEKIKIGSSSTIVSTSDPVRVYEDFATIDLISNGRTEIVAGRASRIGLFELLGYDVRDYEELFEEKFELLLKINKEEVVNWSGKYRAPLRDAKVIPRPVEGSLPIWRAVGGAPASAIKAGLQGVPMYLAHLGGPASSFKVSVDAYRQALTQAGHNPKDFPIATAGWFYAAETTQQALQEAYPHTDLGMKLINGRGYPKQQFAQAQDTRSIMNIGSPQQIIEKMLYQHEMFGHQRFIGQMDFGGVPFDKLMKNIELIGNEILPAVKKYTAESKEDNK